MAGFADAGGVESFQWSQVRRRRQEAGGGSDATLPLKLVTVPTLSPKL